MAGFPPLASPEHVASPEHARPDEHRLRVPLPSLAVAFAAGVGCVFLTGVNQQVTALPAALGLLAVGVMIVAVPVELVRGTAMTTALIATLTLAPTNASGRVILFGVGMAIIALAGAAVRGRVAAGSGGATTGLSGRRFAAVVGATVYFAIVLVSTVLSQHAVSGVIVIISVVAPGLLVVVVARRFTAADFRVLARGVVVLAVAQIVVSLVDLLVRPIPFLGYSSLDGQTRLYNQLIATHLPRAQGLAGHPIVMAVVLIVAAALLWRNVVELPRGIRGTLIVIMVAGVGLTGARSAIVAIAAAAVYLSVALARTVGRRIRNGLLVSTGAVILALIPTTAQFFATALGELSDSGSYTHRAGAWSSLPNLLADRSIVQLFLGSGVGSEHALYGSGLLQQDGLDVIDNQIVTTIVVTGLIGAAVLLLLVARTLVIGTTTVKLVMIMLAVMLNSFDLLRWPGPALLAFLIIGLVDSPVFGRTGSATAPTEPVAAATSPRQLAAVGRR